jgi:hypothetical protein
MAQPRGKSKAKRLLKRAAKLVGALHAAGKDVADLHARFSTANDQFAAGRYSEAELLAEEVVVIANALGQGAVRLERVSSEPSPKLLKAMGAEIRKALEKFQGGRALESQVRKLAREIAAHAVERERTRTDRTAAKLSRAECAQACAELQAGLDLDGRLAGLLAGRELGERIELAISEAISELPGEERLRALADGTVREVLYGKELATLMGEAVNRGLEQSPPPSREEIETYALERVRRELGDDDLSTAIRHAAREVADGAIAERGLISAEEARTAAAEVAGEAFPRLFDSDAARSRIEELARDVATEVADALPVLSRGDAAEIAGEVSAQKLREELEFALGQHLASEDFDNRVRVLTEGVIDAALRARIAEGLIEREASDEFSKRVREIAAEADQGLLGGEALAERVRKVVSAVLRESPPPTWDEIENCAIQRLRSELGGSSVTEGVQNVARAQIESVLGASDFVGAAAAQELAQEAANSVAGPTAGEIGKIAAQAADHALALRDLPDEGRVRAVAQELLGEQLSAAVAGVPTAGEVEQIAARILEAKAGELLGAVPGDEQIRDLAREVAAERVAAALQDLPDEERVQQIAAATAEELRGTVPDEARIHELASSVAAELLTDTLRDLPDEDRLREVASEVADGKITDALAGLPGEDRLRELASEVVAGKIVEAIGGLPDEERLKALAEEAIAGKAAELGESIPDEGRIRELAAEIAAEQLAVLAEELREATPDEAGIRGIAAGVAEEQLRAALRELPGEERVGEIAAAAAAEKIDAAVSDLPDEERFRELAAEVVAVKIAEAISDLPDEERLKSLAEEAITGKAAELGESILDEGRIRELAASVAEDQVHAALRDLPGEDRVGEIAAAAAAEKVDAAVRGIPDEERIRELAGQIAAEKLAAAAEQLGGTPDESDIREIAAAVAEEQVRAAVEALPGEERVVEIAAAAAAAAGEKVDAVLGELPDENKVRELAAAVAEERVGDALKGLPGEEQLRELAADVAAAKIAEVAGSLPGDEQIRELAAEVSAEKMSEALSDLPDEERVRALAEELSERKVGEALGRQLEGDDFAARVKDLTVALLDEKLSGAQAESNGSVPGEDRIRELAAEVVSDRVSGRVLAGFIQDVLEKLQASGQMPGGGGISKQQAEQLDERLREFGATQAELRNAVRGLRETQTVSGGGEADKSQLEAHVRSLLRSYTSSEALAERIAEVAGTISEPAEGEGGPRTREMIDQLVAERVSASVEQELTDEKLAAGLRAAVGAALSERLGASLEAYTSSEALAERIAELSSGGASAASAAPAGLSEDLLERLAKLEEGLEVLPSYLQGTARMYQRLNSLEKNLGRMPDSEQVEEEISELRRQVTNSAEKLSDMPASQTVREMAKSALAETLEQLDRLEAEHSEGRAGEQLRKLIHREVEAAAAAGGKVDHEEIAKVLGALMGTPQFAEKIEGLLPAPEPQVEPAGPDPADIREEVEKRVGNALAEMLHGDELKAELGSLVGMAVKNAQHHELTSTRMLRLKDVQAAINPDEVQAAVPDEQVDELLQRIVSSDDFKVAIDDRFRTMLDYIKSDVIPKQIKKRMESESGAG